MSSEDGDLMTSKATTCALLLGLCVIHQSAFAGDDACKKLMPEVLTSALAKRLHEYRLPQENDNLAEDVRWAREHDGSGCLGVDSGDFYGDGNTQWVVALRSKKNAESALIVVVRMSYSGLHFDELAFWPSLASHLYVGRALPGRYDRGQRDPITENEPEHLTCPHDAVAIGETEANQINYCHVAGNWVSITVSE
jgi:hypothetical protein